MIKFKKKDNGNVIIFDKDDNVVASFSSTMNVLKDPSRDRAFITDDSSPQENLVGYQFSLQGVDLENCEPSIQANTLGELIEALSSSFFFRKRLIPKEITVLNDVIIGGSSSNAQNQLLEVRLDDPNVLKGDTVIISNLQFRGDFGSFNENLIVKIENETFIIGQNGSDSSTFSLEPTFGEQTTDLIELSDGGLGVVFTISPTATVNVSPFGMPNNLWWQLRANFKILR